MQRLLNNARTAAGDSVYTRRIVASVQFAVCNLNPHGLDDMLATKDDLNGL